MKRASKSPTVIPDEQIIDLFWKRDENAIQETDTKYGKYLYKIAYQILHDNADCEECRNDAYLGIWNAIPPARPSHFQAFISQIMRRIAINCYKKQNSQKRVPSELTVCMDDLLETLHSPSTVEEDYHAEELGKAINRYVAELPQKRRYIFIERYYFASPVSSIAKELKLTESSIYKELTGIKQDFKQYLERNGFTI